MTTRKITDLTRLEEPEDNDDLLIRDTSEGEDKRVSVEDLFSEPTVRTLQFDTTAGEQADEEGKLVWRDQDSSLAYRADGIVIDVGQENVVLIRNDTGATLFKGAAVCVAGSSAQRLSVTLSDASPGAGGCRTLGIVAEEIPDNAFGFVSTFGLLRGVDTSAFDEGDELFISTTPGVLTATPPESPARRVTVGYVVVDGVGNGAIFVTLRRGLTLDEVDDVHAPDPQDGQVLRYVDAEDRYEVETLAAADVGAEPDGAVASHSAETEGVHGIADTSELETQAGAQQKVDDRVPDPSGEPDGRVLETDDESLVLRPFRQESDVVVTVGDGGDYASLTEALHDLSRRKPSFINAERDEELDAQIMLLSGFELDEQVFVKGIDLGWIRISSEDAEVNVVRSSLTEKVEGHSRFPVFDGQDATMPRIDCLFSVDETGESSARYGFYLRRSLATFSEGAGIKGAERNLNAAWGSIVQGRGAVFSDAIHYGARPSNNALVYLRGADLTNCGRSGLRVGSAIAHASHADMSGAVEFEALSCRGGVVFANNADLSDSIVGIRVDNGGAVMAPNADISGCGTGVIVESGSAHVRGANISNAAGDALVGNGAFYTIDAEGADLSGAGGDKVVRGGAGTIYADVLRAPFEDSLTIPASDFISVLRADFEFVSDAPVFTFEPDNVSVASCTVPPDQVRRWISAGYTRAVTSLRLANLGSGSGNVQFRQEVGVVTPGQSYTGVVNQPTLTHTAAGQMVFEDIAVSPFDGYDLPDDGGSLVIRVRRSGSSSIDTLMEDMGLLSVSVTPIP